MVTLMSTQLTPPSSPETAGSAPASSASDRAPARSRPRPDPTRIGTDPAPPPSTAATRRPGRGGWVAALILVAVLGFGAGFFASYLRNDGLRQDVEELTAQRDDLQTDLDDVTGERDGLRADLDQATVSADACRAAVATARAFGPLLDEMDANAELWWETAEGSDEAAALDAAFAELDRGLRQTQGRFDAQAATCLTDGAS